MWTRWNVIDRGGEDPMFAALQELRRRLDRTWDDFDRGAVSGGNRGVYPLRANLFDNGQAFVVKADVPGLKDNDLALTLNADTLTIQGERRVEVPEGYAVHRRERLPLKFARTFSFPCKVDPERTTAQLKDGVLTVTVSKTPESQPRRIEVKAS